MTYPLFTAGARRTAAWLATAAALALLAGCGRQAPEAEAAQIGRAHV